MARQIHTEGEKIYFPDLPENQEAINARHGMANAVRALAVAVRGLDLERLSPGELNALGVSVRQMADRLAIDCHTNTRPGPDSFAGSLYELGPFTGRSNPISVPMHLARDGECTVGWAEYGLLYEGGVGDVHGGVLAAAFDDLLGAAQMILPVKGRTGTLTVKYRSVSPLRKRIDYRGWVDRVEGRKIFCAGTAHCEDRLLAEAEAVFIAPRKA